MRYWIGVDFGQAHDYTAVAILERVMVEDGGALFEMEEQLGIFKREPVEAPYYRPELHLRYLRRPPLGTPYERIADGIVKRLCELEPTGTFGERRAVGLAVDGTGVGRPVVDMLHRRLLEAEDAPMVHFWPVVVTAGNRVTKQGLYMGVPKIDLISAVLAPFQNDQLKIGADIADRGVLERELANYRRNINLQSGHTTFEPWREREHDDLLFAVALACWAWGFVREQDLSRFQHSSR